MKRKPFLELMGDFMAGKGFYIVLFLCVVAIGVSGYYLFSNLNPGGEVAVGGNPQIEVTPTPQASPGTKTPAPTPGAAVTASPPVISAPPATPTPAPAATPAAKPVYTWPVKGELIRDYSLEVLAYDETMGDWRTHSGVDIAAELGTQVLAITGGVVERIEQHDLMGTMVVIDHGDGLKSMYANLASTPAVQVGDSVSTGTVIGSVGSTAIAESGQLDHLHMEMTLNDESIDPVNYLPAQNG